MAFFPYILLLCLSLIIKWYFWKTVGLWLSYISILIYYLLAFWYFWTERKELEKATFRWLKNLLVITAILLISYSPALFYYIGYIGGATLYALGIFFVILLMADEKRINPLLKPKYQSSSLSANQSSIIKSQLNELMNEQQVYLNPDLTLQKLAGELNTSTHFVSRVINEEFQMSFSDYINTHRLNEAKRRLVDEKYRHLKISALSYDCGFNSVPTFNTLFKKKEGITPSQYRKKKNSSNP